MARRRWKQLELIVRKRAKAKQRSGSGAGPGARARKVDGFLPHIAREEHHATHPVHVTMRRVETGPSFRAQRVCAAIRGVIEGAKRNGVRVLHYSVQVNHLHLMVEGASSADLSSQMRTLFSRVAFAVNAVARRHGRLFRDRHHRHALKTPREVRNALVYILFNDRKHQVRLPSAYVARVERGAALSLDPCCSGWWFHDWAPSDPPPPEWLRGDADAPTSKPETWLASRGWKGQRGTNLLRFSEQPVGARA